MRLAAGIEYDGTPFCGWQRQPQARSIQGEVEAALSSVADHEVTVVCAGRTDAGVHALGQVIHFDTHSPRSDRAWVLGTNTRLPAEISLRWARPVPEDFHARYTACSRSYRYLILDRWTRSALHRDRVCWVRASLDVERMQEAARYLLGEHDFSSFRAAACQSLSVRRRVTSVQIRRRSGLVRIDISANAFLHHMVRNIAGVLMVVGKAAAEPHWVEEVLRAHDRRAAAATAPAAGLYLMQVRYPGEFGLETAPDNGLI